ncbi:MAG: polymerase subunit gamma/tau [Patescibacteria group bacterium]|nr:polymerase subunit gamma/tau [Patescibacteria group bacterium]
MSEIALYRKYRPSSFDDVLGQEHIVKVLKGALKLGNIAHAYLFFGTRGTGKTSVARIMAQELKTSDADIYEIDAASNRGIDDIRELRDSVRTLPFNSDYKVYIIDEVHMLTKEAFNALLKTLEEPPKHVIFILATTELDKVPETIISRCQTFTFKKPTLSVLKDLVLSVSKKENFTLDNAGAELISILGDGSFRDTHGILQKVISFSKDRKLSIKEIEEVTGAPSGELVNEFIGSLVESDIQKGFEAVKKAESQNIEMEIYLKLILTKLRLALLMRFAPEMKKDLEEEIADSDKEFFKEIVKEKKGVITSKSLEYLLEAEKNLKHSFIKSLPIELALTKILKVE